MQRETRRLLDLFLHDPKKIGPRVNLEQEIVNSRPEHVFDVLHLAENIQSIHASLDVSRKIPPEIWHAVTRRLAGKDIPYDNPDVILRALRILDTASRRRGACVINKFHRVIQTIRSSSGYLSKGRVSRPISLRMVRILQRILDRPEADRAVRRHVPPLLEVIQKDRANGIRQSF